MRVGNKKNSQSLHVVDLIEEQFHQSSLMDRVFLLLMGPHSSKQIFLLIKKFESLLKKVSPRPFVAIQ